MPEYSSESFTCSAWDVGLYYWRIPSRFLSWVRIPKALENRPCFEKEEKSDEVLVAMSPSAADYCLRIAADYCLRIKESGPPNGTRLGEEGLKNMHPPLFERLGNLDPDLPDDQFRSQCADFCESTCIPFATPSLCDMCDTVGKHAPFNNGAWVLAGLNRWRALARDFRNLLRRYRTWEKKAEGLASAVAKDAETLLVSEIAGLQGKYPTTFKLSSLDGVPQILTGVANLPHSETPLAWAVHDLAKRVALTIDKRKGFEYHLCPECQHYGPSSAMSRYSSLSREERAALGYPPDGEIWLHRLSKINVNQNGGDYHDGPPPDCYQKVRKRVNARRKAKEEGRAPGKRGRPRKTEKTLEGV